MNIKTKPGSREETLLLNSLSGKKNEGSLHVWHDVPPAGRWVEWAQVSSGGVQVGEQREEEMSGDRQCSLRWACDTAWPPVRPGLLLVMQQPGMGQADSNMERTGLGRVRRMYERQMNWCMQIYVRSGKWGRTHDLYTAQNVAAGVSDRWAEEYAWSLQYLTGFTTKGLFS